VATSPYPGAGVHGYDEKGTNLIEHQIQDVVAVIDPASNQSHGAMATAPALQPMACLRCRRSPDLRRGVATASWCDRHENRLGHRSIDIVPRSIRSRFDATGIAVLRAVPTRCRWCARPAAKWSPWVICPAAASQPGTLRSIPQSVRYGPPYTDGKSSFAIMDARPVTRGAATRYIARVGGSLRNTSL